MSDAVIIALLGTVGGVLTTVLTIIGGVLLKRTAEIRYQVKNDHGTNLRTELDERHGENVDKLDRIDGRLDVIERRLDRHSTRLAVVEETTEGRKQHGHDPPPGLTRRELRGQRTAYVPQRR